MAKKQRKKEEWENNMVETKSIADRIVDVIVYLCVALVALCSVLPMWHVLMSSFSDGKSLLAHVGLVLWPVGGFTLDGYSLIFQNASIVGGYINTIIYTISFTVIGFLLSAVTGYALSRDTKLKKPVTMALMVTMLFGGGMVPTYMIIRALGWVGTPWALVIPMIASGDLPDLIDAVICEPPRIMVEKGYGIEITDYVLANMPNYVTLVHSNPVYFNNAVSVDADGNEHYYGLTNLQDDYDAVFQGYM